jgi:hypothetical protein
MATASHSAVPGHIPEAPSASLSLAREPDAPTSASPIPGTRTLANQIASAAIDAVLGPKPAGTPDTKPPQPPVARVLPAWLAVLLTLSTSIGTALATVAGLGVQDSKRIEALEAAAAKSAAESATQREELAKIHATLAAQDTRSGAIEEVVAAAEVDRVEEVRYLIALSWLSLDKLGVEVDERPAMSTRLSDRYRAVDETEARRKLFGSGKPKSGKFEP